MPNVDLKQIGTACASAGHRLVYAAVAGADKAQAHSSANNGNGGEVLSSTRYCSRSLWLNTTRQVASQQNHDVSADLKQD